MDLYISFVVFWTIQLHIHPTFWRVIEGAITKCVWENLRQLLGYFKAKFKGDKKPYFKVVNTIAWDTKQEINGKFDFDHQEIS